MISDMESAAEPNGEVEVHTGQFVWLPAELDQGFDRLFMTPVAYREEFIGASLTYCRFSSDGPFRPGWATHYSPRSPLTVQWPCSWLNVLDKNQKVSNKAIHGWLDWRDLFDESFSGRVQLSGSDPTVIAILPPGDQVWPGGRNQTLGRQLDVFIAQMAQPDLQKSVPSKPKIPPSAIAQLMLFGIGIDAKEAVSILTARDPKEDAALLQKLLGKVHLGKARIILCAGSPIDQGNRQMLVSARQHNYPTEMPSIPSSWGSQSVGTDLEINHPMVNLNQDLAAPARSEWKLAKDVPEAIMWEPRFRRLKIQSHATDKGTHLLSLLHVPEVMEGEGIPKDETVLIFSQSDEEAPELAPVIQNPPSDPLADERIRSKQAHRDGNHHL